jgi:outer membrane protein TolC
VQIQHQDIAVKSAEKTVAIAQDGYKLGINPYLNVLTARTTLLPNQETPVNLRIQQMTAMDLDLVAHLFEGLQAEGVGECVVGLGRIIRDEGLPGRIGS